MSRAEAQQKLARKYDHVLEGNVKVRYLPLTVDTNQASCPAVDRTRDRGKVPI